MSAIRDAFSFLTILPASGASAQNMAPARAYFPLVGIALGGALALLDVGLGSLFPGPLTDALLLSVLIAATRGLHLEGFLDCCDGLFGGFSRERRLEILSDPHIGAFAAIGCGILLLTIWSALIALTPPIRTIILVLFPCLSRWAMLLAMATFPYTRRNGLGTAFILGASRWQVVVGLTTATVASLLLAGWAGLVLLAVASAIAWLLGAWITRLLGGLTGDGYGVINELSALGVLLTAVAFARAWETLFASPFTR
jgi:adenosylcobinamide-GDP ribazoletransferase